MKITDLSVVPYWGYSQYTPTIPKMYWDVYSQEQRIKLLCKDHDKLCHYASYLAKQIMANNGTIKELEKEFQDFIDGHYDEHYQEIIAKWVDNNLENVFVRMLNNATWFGLTDDGHFCAYIARGWNGITFDTPANYDDENYGRLILKTTYQSYANDMSDK